MRYLIIGMGAIGTYVGGSLSLSGESVIYLERPEVAHRFVHRPLSVEMNGIEKPFFPELVTDSLDLVFRQYPVDVILVAVKSFDTPAVAELLKPYRNQIPAVLSLQNGVENEDVLREYLGSERVIAGTLTSAVAKKESGKVILEKKRGVGVAGGHPISQKIVNSFNQAGLKAILFSKEGDMKWSKLLTNLLANASSAILDLTPAEIFADPRLFRVEAAQFREAVRVMKNLSFQVVDLPGTPVRMLSFLFHHIPERLARLIAARALAAGRGGKMPSFHVDLYRGNRPLEVNYLNGAVVRFGERVEVATPINRFLNETLKMIASQPLEANLYRKNVKKFIEDLSETVRLN